MLCVLKQPPIKSYFSKCLFKEKKKSPRFSVGGGVSSYTQQFGGVVERGVGRSQGGPMTGLLCGRGWGWGWGRDGIFTSRKALPAPGTPSQVLTPAFLRVGGLSWPKSAFQLCTWAGGVPGANSRKLT